MARRVRAKLIVLGIFAYCVTIVIARELEEILVEEFTRRLPG